MGSTVKLPELVSEPINLEQRELAGLRGGVDLCEDEGWRTARAVTASLSPIVEAIGNAAGGKGATGGTTARRALEAATGTWGAVCDEMAQRRRTPLANQPPPGFQQPPVSSTTSEMPEWFMPAMIVAGGVVLVLLLRR